MNLSFTNKTLIFNRQMFFLFNFWFISDSFFLARENTQDIAFGTCYGLQLAFLLEDEFIFLRTERVLKRLFRESRMRDSTVVVVVQFK